MHLPCPVLVAPVGVAMPLGVFDGEMVLIRSTEINRRGQIPESEHSVMTEAASDDSFHGQQSRQSQGLPKDGKSVNWRCRPFSRINPSGALEDPRSDRVK